MICTENAIGWIQPNGRFDEVETMGHLSFAQKEVETFWGVTPPDPESVLLHSSYVKVGRDGAKRYAVTYGVVRAGQWQTLLALGIDEKRVLERKV
jgi:hypothetical protein